MSTQLIQKTIPLSFNFFPPLQEKEKIKPEFNINDIVDFLPETKAIQDYVSRVFNSLHDDLKIKDFTAFFKCFNLDNPTAIFLLYTRVTTNFIKDQEDFREIEKEFKKKTLEFGLKNSSIQSELVTNIIQKTIQSSYRGLPTVAIARALNIDVSKVDLSSFKDTDAQKISIELEDRINDLFNKSVVQNE